MGVHAPPPKCWINCAVDGGARQFAADTCPRSTACCTSAALQRSKPHPKPCRRLQVGCGLHPQHRAGWTLLGLIFSEPDPGGGFHPGMEQKWDPVIPATIWLAVSVLCFGEIGLKTSGPSPQRIPSRRRKRLRTSPGRVLSRFSQRTP
eukprot:gene15706-biopygen14280